MKLCYSSKAILAALFFFSTLTANTQAPTINTVGICDGVVANFNTNDNGFNSPSIYANIFDSSLYFHSGRGYWTDYLPPLRTSAPGFPRVLNIISPPYVNPNPTGSFNVGFYYIVNNPVIDQFQVRIISVTETPTGTITNVEATSGVQTFAAWSTPTAYIDGTTPTSTPVPDPTPLLNGFQGIVCIRLVDPDIVNNPNTRFRVEVSYIIHEPFFAVFDNLSIGPLNIPLPVHFIGLVAHRNSTKGADLRWDVSDEIEVKEYQVERSTNGSTFTTQGSIEAKGKTVYSFTDPNVPAGTIFYRVKSVDLDGRYKYSGILKLKGQSEDSYQQQLIVYPIPANDNITVAHKRLSSKARMVITTLEGRVIRTIIPVEGASHTPVNISGMAQGMYFLRIDEGEGFGPAIKLIKN